MIRRRQPHRLIVPGSAPVVLSFWTAQAAQIARNGADAEREGRLDDARNYFSIARDLSPADEATKRYCDQHARAA